MDKNIVNVSVNTLRSGFSLIFFRFLFSRQMSRITLFSAGVAAALTPLVAMINGSKI